MGGDIDAIVVGVGSGGTLTGVGRFMRGASPKTEMILADPVGSVLAPFVNCGEMIEAGSWTVEGIGEDFVPPNADLSLVRKAYSVTDQESFAAARLMLRMEGIFAGSSSGTLLTAALRYCKQQTTQKRVVTFVCDSGAKYLSKVFNDAFLAQEGWIDRARFNTVRDLVINRYAEGLAVEVRPQDTLRTVFARMRAADVSQMPVIEDDKLVGLVDESDLLAALIDGEDSSAKAFETPVRDVMVTRLETISADAPIKDLVPMFRKDYVAIVMDGGKFLGLVTRIDLINHFRVSL
jgi:cystathionine beta-synthase